MKKLTAQMSNLLEVDFSSRDKTIPENEEQRRINLTSYISVISLFTMLVYSLIYSFIDFDRYLPAIAFLLLFSLINLVIIYINKLGYFAWAKLLTAVLNPLFMLYEATIAFGNSPGFHVYLFIAAMIPVFLWDLKNNRFPIILIVLILVSYVLVESGAIQVEPKIRLTDLETRIFRQTNIFAGFIAAGIAIFIYQQLQNKTEEKLVLQSERLKIAQKQKDKIYSIVGHDLRGPLSTFVGLSDIYLKNYENFSDSERLEMMRAVHQKSVSMLNLLENLLDWSRMKGGEKNLIPSEILLSKIVDETTQLCNDSLSEQNITLVTDFNTNIKLLADEQMVSTIFRNLITNAIKFTGTDGTITISARINNKRAEISIRDTGCGMNPSDLDCLFDSEKVYRIGSNNGQKGSGLGLILCKEFIEQHNGDIKVESAVGVGTTIHFTLPVVPNQ